MFKFLLHNPLVAPLVRPVTRFFIGVIAIPMFRLFLRRVIRLQELDKELEKDLEQWFRGSLLLLAATRNMEETLFDWVPLNLQGEDGVVLLGLRLLLAIGVVECMPDQQLFAVIHPGPPPLHFRGPRSLWNELRSKWRAVGRGLVCQHVNRSSPVFAILAAIVPGTAGWVCYVIAVAQYLIIGLVTSRDRALDVLSVFDRAVAERRREIIDEFHLGETADRRETAAAEPAISPQSGRDGALASSTVGFNGTPTSEIIAKPPGDGYLSR